MYENIVNSLRYCAENDCSPKCPRAGIGKGCIAWLKREAAEGGNMSVLIKGMEMPMFEHQSWDIREGADGKWYMVDTNAETSDGEWHEIVPVQPHGRLIDADDFIKRMEGLVHRAEADGYDFGAAWYTAFIRHIELASTVIEAEECE